MADAYLNRAFRFPLDPTPAQERLLRSYCGAARVAYNWALAEVTSNLAARKTERHAGVPDAELTAALSWSKYSLRKQFNQVKDTEAPWHRKVSKHCFDTGVSQAADALHVWSESRKGVRKGRRVGFPRWKRKGKAKLSVSFVELNHQLSWLRDDRHAVRLMLPQAMWSKDLRARAETLQWIHTVQSTRRLYRLIEGGRASIQKVTISFQGGRWWVSFACRITRPVAVTPRRLEGAVVGVDVGLRHLATLSRPLPGVTDEAGHVPNPAVLTTRLRELARVNRAVAEPRTRRW
jgi:putative transposase